MKKVVFSLVTLLSLVPVVPVHGVGMPVNEQVILPALDPRVLKLFVQPKDEIAIEQVKLLQKNRDQLARIRDLEGTINEESYRKGRNIGLVVGSGIAMAAAAALLSYIASNGSRARRH